ncbi:hypothetical protein CGRA01v4_10911 [Colletotrichum graminicola]|nr:hypothetical protein CGRA01v4_10911 [Colletotrichum graminicola]
MKSLTLLYVLFAIPLASAVGKIRVCRCFFPDGKTNVVDTKSACEMVSGTMMRKYCVTDHDETDWSTTKCLYKGVCWMRYI